MKLLRAFRNKYIQKRILATSVVLAIAFADYQAVLATKIEDAKGKKEEAEQNLEEVNQVMEEIREAQARLKDEMKGYDDQLMALLTDIEILNSDMAAKQMEIDQANLDLEAAKIREQNQYNDMKLRIQYMYENADSSIWTAMAAADSIADFLNRVEYISGVYDYDRKQLETYQETVQQVADLTEQLNWDLAEMEELELNYQEQKSGLEAIIAEKSAVMDDFNAQFAVAKGLASEFAATIQQQNQIIASEKARMDAERAEAERAAAAAAANNNNNNNNNSNNPVPSSGGNTGGDTNTAGSGSDGTGLTTSGLNPSYTTGVSGGDVVAYAGTFVGNPYVYGGNSLTEGCDCSYFVMACFGHFGISLPRSSYQLQSVGQAVSYDCALPGDIICYSGHVAIYTGNGGIVHASSPKNGICYGSATYRTIITIRRVL